MVLSPAPFNGKRGYLPLRGVCHGTASRGTCDRIFPEILGDAGIAYTPNNAHTLTDALEKLLTAPECLSTCSANAHNLSKNRYNDELTASQLLYVYYRDLRN